MGWFKRLKKDQQSVSVAEDTTEPEIIESQPEPIQQEEQSEIINKKEDELQNIENKILEKEQHLKGVSDKLASVKEEYNNAI